MVDGASSPPRDSCLSFSLDPRSCLHPGCLKLLRLDTPPTPAAIKTPPHFSFHLSRLCRLTRTLGTCHLDEQTENVSPKIFSSFRRQRRKFPCELITQTTHSQKLGQTKHIFPGTVEYGPERVEGDPRIRTLNKNTQQLNQRSTQPSH